MKIAIIEDDKTISFAVKAYLEKSGNEIIVFETLEAIVDVSIDGFDLMILDVNLPDGSGFDYLKYIREFSEVPVIMLTVKDADEYIIQGFNYGADEYITKPFSLAVLKARIENILKRKDKEKTIEFRDLKLDLNSKTAHINEENIDLNKQEFAVLHLLLDNKGFNLTRERIIDKVWGQDLYEVNDNTLTVTIKRLRKKLKDYGQHIKTIRGIGYRWECEEK